MTEIVQNLKADVPLAENQEELCYTDEYAVIEAEQQKLTSLYGEKIDYLVVIKSSLALLQQGAGHFMILTALSHALVQQYHWYGFIESLSFLNECIANQWEQLYPAPGRMKGRVQPMTWLVERLQRYLETHPITGLGKDFSERALNALQEFD